MGLSTKDSIQKHVINIQIEKINSKEDLNREGLNLQNFFQVLSKISKNSIRNHQRDRLVNRDKDNEIQNLFCNRKHRAVQEVLFGPIVFCKIDKTKVEEHYKSLLADKQECKITALPKELWPKPISETSKNSTLIKKFTCQEVKKKLSNKVQNEIDSSRGLGLDRISYCNLSRHDQDCSKLTAFFNACLKLETIPDNWKETYSVLIRNEKNKEENDINNWHSVTMINTIPKLFQTLISSRLYLWAKDNNRFSPTQKGFLLNDAACESSFLLQTCKTYAQKNKKDLAIAWLDFSKASELLPQEAVLYALNQLSVPKCMINIIHSMLVNVDTKMRVSDNSHFTKPIKILKGLPQGAPINPVLINLVIEPILKTLSSEENILFEIFDQKINHFVIPNELTLIGESHTHLQSLLNLVEEQSKLIGLKFNINNCFTYRYNHIKNKVDQTQYSFFGQSLQNLPENKITEFFGVRQGLSIGQNRIPTIHELTESIEEVQKSHLNIFQKLESILTFLMPRVENCLRGLQNCDITLIKEVDKLLKNNIIAWLCLPDNATDESIVFHVDKLKWKSKKKFLPFLDLFYIMKIVHGFKMLTSNDKLIKTVALKSLDAEVNQLITKKGDKKITNEQLGSYLTGNLNIKSTKTISFWKGIREATLHLKIKINLAWNFSDDNIQLIIKKKKKKVIPKGHSLIDFEEHLKKCLLQFYVNKIRQKNPEDIKKLEAIGSKIRKSSGGYKKPTTKSQNLKVPAINTVKVPSLLSTQFPVLYKEC